MKTIEKINGKWNYSFKNVFNNYDAWIGNIVLENNCFEGVVKERFSYDRFVFGILNEKEIQLIKVASIKDSFPSIYQATIESSSYQGRVYELGMYASFLKGVCQIKTTSLDYLESQEKKIQDKIDKYKNNMDNVSKDLYLKLLSMKEQIVIKKENLFSGDLFCLNNLPSDEEPILKLIPRNKEDEI